MRKPRLRTRAGAVLVAMLALAQAGHGEQAPPPGDTASSVLETLTDTKSTDAQDDAKDDSQTTDETIIVSHGFSQLGALKYGPDFAKLAYANENAPKGGEMSIWQMGTFDNFSPISRKGNSAALASTVMLERLMTSTADDPGADYGLLAETIEYPESQDWVIFNLRPEATFSDGTPVTAEDVKFTFDLLMEQAYIDYRLAVSALVEKAEVLGPLKVKFTFRDGVPRDGLISQMGSNPVMSKAWFERTGMRLDEASLTPIMGTGPYVLDSYDINRRVVYRRNPDYWANDLPVTRGHNNYDTIRVEYFADSNAALEGFSGGAYLFRVEDNSKTWATAYNFPGIEKGYIKKAEIPDMNLPANSGFIFNLLRPKFQDVRVREAIGLMFNFEWTNKTLRYGLFKQRNSFWENSDLGASGVPEGDELALLESLGDLIDPALLTDEPVMAPTSGSSKLDMNNKRRATRLLTQAGWTQDDRGNWFDADGQMLTLDFLAYDPNTVRIANSFIENLNSLGVKATLTRVGDDTQYEERRREKDFDMVAGVYYTNLVPGLGMYQRFGSEDAEYSHHNPAAFADPAADKLIDKLVGATTREEFRTATRALDRLFRAERFVIPTGFTPNTWVAYYDQYEHPDELPPYALGYLDFWWYNADKGAKLQADGAY